MKNFLGGRFEEHKYPMGPVFPNLKKTVYLYKKLGYISYLSVYLRPLFETFKKNLKNLKIITSLSYNL